MQNVFVPLFPLHIINNELAASGLKNDGQLNASVFYCITSGFDFPFGRGKESSEPT